MEGIFIPHFPIKMIDFLGELLVGCKSTVSIVYLAWVNKRMIDATHPAPATVNKIRLDYITHHGIYTQMNGLF